MEEDIILDFGRDHLFDELGLKRLRESYMRDDEISPQQRFAYVSKQFGSNKEHSQRLYDYSSKHWLSYATPILAFGKTPKSLPISCFLSHIHDTREGLVETLSEVNWLSMFGGGVGIGFGIRSADEKSVGVLPHLKVYDASSLAYRQGSTRRGSYAAYIDINHPDVKMFIDIRKPTGDPNLRCLNMHHGLNITDDFMQIIENCMDDPSVDDSWKLIDPHTQEVKDVVSAKGLWQAIIETRMLTGEPYLHFIDRSNEKLPQWLKDKGLKVRQSNLCSEITLPTDNDRTAVCCLSSVNLEYFDEWKNEPLFLHDIAEMLDNVLTYFIENAPEPIKRAKLSAERERSIGVGALGFHAYLQKNNIEFESALAISANMRMFKYINENLQLSNFRLGAERGEAPDAVGTGRRFSHMQAIAPNASSSIIMGNTSPSVEPWRANAYRQDTISGASLNKNKYLNQIIKQHCMDNPKEDPNEIWSSIISHKGSVQHLTFLNDHQKRTFKTAMEIDQRWIIELAAGRQQYIDQSQSINLFFPPNVDIKYLNFVHVMAWKKGMKSLYYCRSEKIGETDKISEQIDRNIIEELTVDKFEECLPCSG